MRLKEGLGNRVGIGKRVSLRLGLRRQVSVIDEAISAAGRSAAIDGWFPANELINIGHDTAGTTRTQTSTRGSVAMVIFVKQSGIAAIKTSRAISTTEADGLSHFRWAVEVIFHGSV